MSNHLAWAIGGLVSATLLLSACAPPRAMESEFLATLAAERTKDSTATEMCIAHGTGFNLIASADSSSADVRLMGEEVKTHSGWDKELNEFPGSYVAVCVYDIEDLPTPYPNATYLAQFIISQPSFRGNQVLTYW